MKRYIIGNWKCHKSSDDGRRWLDSFAELYSPKDNIKVIIAPSFVVLESIADHLQQLGLDNVYLAAQDLSPYPKGSYTGAVAADMLRGLVQYVITGHSERRRYFHENNRDVANKVSEACDADLIPIVCVDSSYALAQLAALVDIDCEQMIVAYTPVDALNVRASEPVGNVSEAVRHIREMYSEWPIIYGGALEPGNAEQYLTLPELSGIFLGSTSLDAEKFSAVCSLA
jgi:triosephosphate isomerase